METIGDGIISEIKPCKGRLPADRIRDAAPAILEALIEARFYVKMALDNCYNPVAEKKLEKIDAAIAAARGDE